MLIDETEAINFIGHQFNHLFRSHDRIALCQPKNRMTYQHYGKGVVQIKVRVRYIPELKFKSDFKRLKCIRNLSIVR